MLVPPNVSYQKVSLGYSIRNTVTDAHFSAVLVKLQFVICFSPLLSALFFEMINSVYCLLIFVLINAILIYFDFFYSLKRTI